ncbi:MAG: response regulator [Leptospirales bacterium]
MTLSALVVEDEYWARRLLIKFIESRKELRLEAQADNGLDAEKYIDNQRFDLVFLDLNLPEKDGLSLLPKIDKSTIVIIITNRRDSALQAYEEGVIDYVLKPFDEKRFHEAVDRAVRYYSGEKGVYEKEKLDHIIQKYENLFKVLQQKFYLTYQEASICKSIVQGESRQRLMEVYEIGATTLKSHLRTIYSKTIDLESVNFSEKHHKFHELYLFLNKVDAEFEQ